VLGTFPNPHGVALAGSLVSFLLLAGSFLSRPTRLNLGRRQLPTILAPLI